MQYLENDMDELFRKAADKYPLKTEASDWDKIAPALARTNSSVGSGHSAKRKYAWLLLLVFLFAASPALILFFNKKHGNPDSQSFSGVWKKENSNSKTTIPGRSQKENTVSITKNNRTRYIEQVVNSNPASANESNRPPVKKIFSTLRVSEAMSAETELAFNRTGDERVNYPLREMPVILSEKANLSTELIRDQNQINIGDDLSKKIPVTPDGKRVIKKQGFYVGIISGPQLNQVRSQGYNKPSVSTGLLVGYGLNKRISIETGLFFTKKHYQSEGKYFDMEKAKLSMPSGMKVLSLKGSSAVFEIPVKIKYDFLRRTNNSFFASAGVSSYLLTKESNDYLTLINGTQQRMIGNYQNATKYFAGSINVSAGYNQKIGNQLSIRMEPYIQMPIKGLGVGAMPVSSAGLHIGIIWDRK